MTSSVLLAIGALVAVGAGSLPSPPQRAVFHTRVFGEVTLDHAAHLARRTPCRSCHGEGPVKKVEHLGAARAHEVCRGCHQELARGPTGCRDCHVVDPKKGTAVADAATPTPPATETPAATPTAIATATETPTATPTAIAAATETPAATETATSIASYSRPRRWYAETSAPEELPPPPPPPPARPPPRFSFAGAALTTTAGLSHAFDGRRDVTSAFEVSIATRAGGGTFALVAGDALSSGGSAWSAGCRAGTTRTFARWPIDLAADLRLARLRAAVDGSGRTVASDVAATLPVAGARAGITFAAWPGTYVSVAAVIESSLGSAEREYQSRACAALVCPEGYRLGGFSYGLALALGASRAR